jgi:glucosamine--fructose-6-phosphate aminotransferase (isomerizing)
MAAGPELSVAATKTFVASLSALLNLVAAWAGERAIKAALARLPDRLASASEFDWSKAFGSNSVPSSLVILGRGPTLAIAREASLKLKEVCNIHAEAFSGAEFQHGPITLVSKDYPVLIFAVPDATGPNLAEVAADLGRKGASVLITADSGIGTRLPTLVPDHPDADTLCLIQSFYALAIHLARHRGINVDQPRHLRKVTRTR